MKRYYYHGDIVTVDGVEKIFCARCDLFVLSQDFAGGYQSDSPCQHTDTGKNLARYKAMKKHGVPSGFFRPDGAENCLA